MGIGERIREERNRLNYDQEEFSAIGGVGKQAQSKYENNKSEPNASYLENIGKKGADIFYILTGNRLDSNGVRLYKEVGEALEVAIDIQKELGLTFTADQIQSVIGFAWTAQASRDQVVAFVRGAHQFSGLPLPDS